MTNEEVNNKEDKKTSPFKKVIKVIASSPLVIKIIIIVLFVGALLFIGNKLNLVSISFNTNTNTRETTLEYTFQDVGELVTQEMYLRELEDTSISKDINGWVVPFTTSREIFSIDVEVLASVDFTQITFAIDNTNKSILIKLPHSKIYKSYMVDGSFASYLDQDSWFSEITHEDQAKLESELVKKAVSEAEDKGIIDKADENAKTIIENMISGYNDFKDYTVNFQYID